MDMINGFHLAAQLLLILASLPVVTSCTDLELGSPPRKRSHFIVEDDQSATCASLTLAGPSRSELPVVYMCKAQIDAACDGPICLMTCRFTTF